jgi:hypothetical protein
VCGKKKSGVPLVMALVASLAFMVVASTTQADPPNLTIELWHEFSGAQTPSGTEPFLVATFQQTGLDEVTLTMDSYLQGPTEFVDVWDFNVDPTIAGLSVAYLSGVMAKTVGIAEDSFKADGDGYFDIQFDFANGPPSNRFGPQGGIQSVYEFSATGLTPWSFNFLSLGEGNSPDGLLTAAHIEGIGEGSGWITNPAPGSSLLAVMGLGVIALVGKRRLDS